MEPGTDAQILSDLIEDWLGNPISRGVLGFVTRRDEAASRIDKVLKAYAGIEGELDFWDWVAFNVVRSILDNFGEKMNLDRNEIKDNLRVGYWRRGLGSVLEGLAWRGPRKPFTSYSPFLVVWNFTDTCNLMCQHCYQEAGVAKKELTTDQAIYAVDTLADAGVSLVAFSGGEPLMRYDFYKVAEHVKEHGMGLSLATNGTALTPKCTTLLRKMEVDYVQVSLDGLKETHDRFRGIDCFDRVLEGIRNGVDAGLNMAVSMAVTKLNLNEVEDVLDLAESLGVGTFMHYNFIPTGRGRNIIDLDITPEEREELLVRLSDWDKSQDIKVLSTAPQFSRICLGNNSFSMSHFDTFSQIDDFSGIRGLAEFIGGCGAGRLYCALQPNGDISPCVFMPITVGNILENDFMETWRTSKVFNKLRNRLNMGGSCNDCDSKFICGGCRARSYSYFGDLKGPDPGCVNNVEAWNSLRY